MIFGRVPDFLAIIQCWLALLLACGLIFAIIGLIGLKYFKHWLLRFASWSILFIGLLTFFFSSVLLCLIRIDRTNEMRIAHYVGEYEIILGELDTEAVKRRKETITYDYPNSFWGVVEKQQRRVTIKYFDFAKNPRENALGWHRNHVSMADTRDIVLKLILDDRQIVLSGLDTVNYRQNPVDVPTVLRQFPHIKTTRTEYLYILFLKYPPPSSPHERRTRISEILSSFVKLGFTFDTPAATSPEVTLPIEGAQERWLLRLEDVDGHLEVLVKEKFLPITEQDIIRYNLDNYGQ